MIREDEEGGVVVDVAHVDGDVRYAEFFVDEALQGHQLHLDVVGFFGFKVEG